MSGLLESNLKRVALIFTTLTITGSVGYGLYNLDHILKYKKDAFELLELKSELLTLQQERANLSKDVFDYRKKVSNLQEQVSQLTSKQETSSAISEYLEKDKKNLYDKLSLCESKPPVEVVKEIVVEKPVEKIVDKVVYKDKIVEKVVYKDKIVEKVVYKEPPKTSLSKFKSEAGYVLNLQRTDGGYIFNGKHLVFQKPCKLGGDSGLFYADSKGFGFCMSAGGSTLQGANGTIYFKY